MKILGVLFLKYGVFLVKTRCEFSDKSQKNNPLAPNDRLLCYKLFIKDTLRGNFMSKETAYYSIQWSYREITDAWLRFKVIKDSSKKLEDCVKEGFAQATRLPLSKVEEIFANTFFPIEETPLSVLADIVSKSDVVIANPYHFSVAINRYEQNENMLFQLTAKGTDEYALYMQQVAKANGIPVVKNIPFARAAYMEIEIGNNLPENYLDGITAIYKKLQKL